MQVVNTLFTDLRYAMRQLRHAPGFTATALLMLGLGIGSVVAVLSIVYAVLLRPYGFEQAGKLVVWHEVVREWQSSTPYVPVNYKHYLMFKERARSLEEAAIFEAGRFSVAAQSQGSAAHPMTFDGLVISPELFSVLGVPPSLGRSFSAQETLAGSDAVVMLGWAAWQRLFQADPAALGRSLIINGKPHTVIGVLPRSFRFPPLDAMGGAVPSGSTDLYQVFVPLVVSEETKAEDTSDFNYTAMARLRPGVSVQQAQAEMNGLEEANRLSNHLPIHISVQVSTLKAAASGPVSTALWLLLAATGGVLLIACVNLTNLQLARGVARQRELALRSALGAARARLMQTALAESAALAAMGAVVGWGLAFAAVRATVAFGPPSLPRINELSVSWPALLAAAGLACASALLSGLLPAVAAMRADPQTALRSGGGTQVAGSAQSAHTRRVLVAAEIACSVALLALAGLAGRSFSRVMTENWQFSSDHVLLAQAQMVAPEYGGFDAEGPDASAQLLHRKAFLQQALRDLQALPGVSSVGVTDVMPLTGDQSVDGLARPDHLLPESLMPMANQRLVSPGYFQTMQIPIVAGRGFTEQDMEHPLVAIISEKAAKAAWPEVNPLGHKLARWDRQFTIIGIAADARINDVKRDVAVFYLPVTAEPTSRPVFVVGSSLPAATLAPAVRQVLWSIDPQLGIPSVTPMAEQVSGSLARERLQTALLSGFGATALLLAALGVYGVLAYSVSLRGREFGIRMALGSPRAALSQLVLRDAAWPVLAGLTAGLALALFAGRWVQSLLYQTAASDPVALGGSVLLLLAAALVAAMLPALRAADTELIRVLRES